MREPEEVPAPVDARHRAAAKEPHDPRDDVRIARPPDRSGPHDRRREAALPVSPAHDPLAGELALRVEVARGRGRGRGALGDDPSVPRKAQDRERAQVDEPPHSLMLAGGNDVSGPLRVRGEERLARTPVGDASGCVEDEPDAARGAGERVGVLEIPADDVDAESLEGFEAGGAAAECPHAVTARHQRCRQVPPEESRRPGDEHRGTICHAPRDVPPRLALRHSRMLPARRACRARRALSRDARESGTGAESEDVPASRQSSCCSVRAMISSFSASERSQK